MAARFCQRCGRALGAGSAFCTYCGAPVAGSAPTVCQRCGGPLVPNATFCAHCGSPVGGVPGPGAYPGTSPPLAYGAPAPYGGFYLPAGLPAPVPRDAEVRALSSVATAGLIGMLSFLVTIAGVVVGPLLTITGGLFISLSSTTPTSTIVYLVVVVAAALFLGLLQIWYFRAGFSELAPYDSRFAGPKTFATVALIGALALAVAVPGFFVLFFQVAACANGTPAPTNGCLDLGLAIGLFALLAIGGIVAFVGLIGMAIGIWRLGTRYNEGLFKAGAILLFLFGFVGSILIFAAARSARNRVSLPAPTYSFG